VSYAVNLADIQAAADRIGPHVHRTPVLTSRTLDGWAGRRLFFKCELFQRGGAFKIRGALNAVLQLSEAAAARGVITHSSGNHGAALAMAAGIRGIPVTVVVPRGAPAVKRAAIEGYGATIVDCAPGQAARQATCDRICAETGATWIPSYDHPHVIAGQGTMSLEFVEQADLDAMIVPIGGGGMISGIALALAELRPGLPVFAAEPAGADDAARSKAAGRLLPQEAPATIADGLRTSLGGHTWPVVRDHVVAVHTVSEDQIRAAMRHIWERLKVVAEPSAAVGLAVALSAEFRERVGAERVGIVLCGGNVDLDALPW